MRIVAGKGLVSTAFDALKTTYIEKIAPSLIEEFNYANVHQVPKLERIVVRCGIADASQDSKGVAAAVNDLALITGQRPIITRTKKAIAASKMREGQPIGLACTLRGSVMYSFLDRFINLGEFQVVSYNSFDGKGNYRIGFREQSAFPELSLYLLGKPMGMDISIATTAKTDEEAYRLLALLGIPFGEGGLSGPGTKSKKLMANRF